MKKNKISTKKIIEYIESIENSDEANKIRDVSVRNARRVGSGLKFDMLGHLEEKLSGVEYLGELSFERSGLDINGFSVKFITRMAKEINSFIDDKTDRADYYSAAVKIDMDIPSTLYDGFALYFMRNNIDELVRSFVTKEGNFSLGKDAPSLSGAIISYCTAKNKDLFDFCEMALEIVDTVPKNGDEARRRANHQHLLKVEEIRYVLKNKERYLELFKQEKFFEEDPVLRVDIGESKFTFHIREDMSIENFIEEKKDGK